MPEIHILDSNTIDKIAAGEVVERPASVVKELVENSIDAGASAITVEIKDGGTTMIRVTDNGYGIEQSQLKKAFMRHATSKIEDAEDLMNIHSLGFRGEALSSICAVSMLEMITKTEESLTGVSVHVDGGVMKNVQEVGAPTGTTIIVRNLFYNTPARRKFLKSAATEGSYVSELMEHMALSRADISFTYRVNGQLKFHTPGNHKIKDVIYMLYGREMSEETIAVDEESSMYHLYGYIGKPCINRGNRNHEIFFVNGRYIKSNIISKAVEEGGRGYYMQHKFPFCVLMLELPPDLMDVNVHPTKLEVRFSNQNALFDFIMDTVRVALKTNELIPEVSIGPEIRKPDKPVIKSAPEPFENKRRAGIAIEENRAILGNHAKGQTEIPQQKEIPGKVQAAGSPDTDRLTIRPVQKDKLPASMADKTEAEIAEQSLEALKILSGTDEGKPDGFTTLKEEIEKRKNQPKPSKEPRPFIPVQFDVDFEKEEAEKVQSVSKNESNQEKPQVVLSGVEESQETQESLPTVDKQANAQNREAGEEELPFVDVGWKSTKEQAVSEQTEHVQNTVLQSKNAELVEAEASHIREQKAEQISLFENRVLQEQKRLHFNLLGQAFDTYWLFTCDDGLYLMDQHAAHEKVNFERLMKKLETKQVTSQQVNPPLILTLTAAEQHALFEYKQYFTDFGFEIEEFGGNEIALRAIPQDLYGCNEKTFFEALLDELMDSEIKGSPQVIYDKIASMACKAAVKGNNVLSAQEVNALITELLSLENPYHCPHGRPTLIKMTQYELDRKFKRIIG